MKLPQWLRNALWWPFRDEVAWQEHRMRQHLRWEESLDDETRGQGDTREDE